MRSCFENRAWYLAVVAFFSACRSLPDTVGEAAVQSAEAVCELAERCDYFPVGVAVNGGEVVEADDIDTCISAFVDLECSSSDCAAPFELDADLWWACLDGIDAAECGPDFSSYSVPECQALE